MTASTTPPGTGRTSIRRHHGQECVGSPGRASAGARAGTWQAGGKPSPRPYWLPAGCRPWTFARLPATRPAPLASAPTQPLASASRAWPPSRLQKRPVCAPLNSCLATFPFAPCVPTIAASPARATRPRAKRTTPSQAACAIASPSQPVANSWRPSRAPAPAARRALIWFAPPLTTGLNVGHAARATAAWVQMTAKTGKLVTTAAAARPVTLSKNIATAAPVLASPGLPRVERRGGTRAARWASERAAARLPKERPPKRCCVS